MTDSLALAHAAHRALRAAIDADAGSVDEEATERNTRVTPGLSAEEIADIERRFGFKFAEVHRDFLSIGLPIGDAWPNWRDLDDRDLAVMLAWPVDGLVLDVRANAYWPEDWGDRPDDDEHAAAVAVEHLRTVPRMVPLHQDRYLPAGPVPLDTPVFLLWGTDAVYLGVDFADWAIRDFGELDTSPTVPTHRIDFWSDLVDAEL